MQHRFGNRFCQLCKNENESPLHILLYCEKLEVVRHEYWVKLENTMPPALKQEFENRHGKEKLFWLLSPLGNSYVKEWGQIYCQIAVFVHKIYELRHILCKSVTDF